MKKYNNKQNQERYEILNLKETNEMQRFENINLEQLEKLLNKKYLNPKGKHNNSPTSLEFANFLRENPTFKAHGYIINNERDDRRITIEGLEGSEIDKNKIKAFKNFHLDLDADEFVCKKGEQYSWFD